MKPANLTLFFVAAGILVISSIEIVDACPEDLVCSNFTASDKKSDCRYITNQGLSYSEEQEVLCILWDQSYDYPDYNSPDYDYDLTLNLENNEISNSHFILAGKILVFGLINYFTLNLTKSSVVLKWLRVA
jgi:hypothetical protein